VRGGWGVSIPSQAVWKSWVWWCEGEFIRKNCNFQEFSRVKRAFFDVFGHFSKKQLENWGFHLKTGFNQKKPVFLDTRFDFGRLQRSPRIFPPHTDYAYWLLTKLVDQKLDFQISRLYYSLRNPDTNLR